jgi:hypothetical protein
MPEITLLDYEVFEAIKAELTHEMEGGSASFSEAVLGYGFLAVEEDSSRVRFALLCHPSSCENLKASIEQVFAGKRFTFQGIQISILIHSSGPANELLHAITLPEEGSISDGIDAEPTDLSEWIQISLGQTLREVVLNEQRKIILPSYLLRYTPFTSPNLIILRAALSQIHYLHQSGNPLNEFEQRTVSAKMSEISRWSSFSRTSIYRLLHEDPRSRWLVDVENKGSYQNDQGQHISQPNQYLLQPLLLTPGDATDLLAYLKTHHDEWQCVEDCLIELAKIEPRKVLIYPYRLPKAGDFSQPVSILSLIQENFGPIELTAERLALLDKVRDNLIGRDFITVPWYVLRSLLPVYGASIITLFMMCQPLLFRQGGVQRDTFWLPGGEETLLAWTSDRSLAKYFPKANSKGRGRPAGEKGSSDSAWRKGKRELLSDFFLRVESRKDPRGLTQWKIKVHDYPILQQDENLITSLYHVLAALIQNNQLSTLLTLFDREPLRRPNTQGLSFADRLYRTTLSEDESHILSVIAEAVFSDFETPVNNNISNFETPASRLISIFEPPVRQLISESATPVPVLISNFETHIKILYMIKDSIQIIKDTNHPTDSSEPAHQIQDKRADGWHFDQILHSVKPELQQKILQDNKTKTKFLALLVQSCLNARVQQPLNLALSKTIQGEMNPNPAATRLARQTPANLLSVLVMMQTDPALVHYQQDSAIRDIAADIQQLLMGEDGQKQPILIQRLIDVLVEESQ